MVLDLEGVRISVGVGDDEEHDQEDGVGEQLVGHGLAAHLLHPRLLEGRQEILAIWSRQKYQKYLAIIDNICQNWVLVSKFPKTKIGKRTKRFDERKLNWEKCTVFLPDQIWRCQRKLSYFCVRNWWYITKLPHENLQNSRCNRLSQWINYSLFGTHL